MVWPDGKPEKRSAGKERRRTSRLFSEGLQLRNRTGSMRQQTKEYPAGIFPSGGVFFCLLPHWAGSVSEGLQLRNRTGSMRQQTKEYPARGKDSGGVGGLQGKSRMRILASALGACLTRQAGFAAARPAASGGLWQEIRDQ